IFAIFDSALDVYVTLTITIILTRHIKRINSTGARGNINLYISVVLTNAIRTAALSVVNIFATVYHILNIINIYIVWPIVSIVLLITVGYDTNITYTIKRLRDQSQQGNDSHTIRNTLLNSNCSSSSPTADRHPLKRQEVTNSHRLSDFRLDRNGDLESGDSYYIQHSRGVHNHIRPGDRTSLSCTILEMSERDSRDLFIDRSKSF
ncbi:hypothetical protein BD770DRAFT_319508, partial [Pilaira anomala]